MDRMISERKAVTGLETERIIRPGAAIGVLGGGQLGRMMALAGSNLGYRFIALDPTPAAPCGQVAEQIVAAYSDKEAAKVLAERSDVITYEFENVDAEVRPCLRSNPMCRKEVACCTLRSIVCGRRRRWKLRAYAWPPTRRSAVKMN